MWNRERESDFVYRVNHLRKLYFLGARVVEALAGVSLDIRKGEFVAIVGKSGSGKTTLLHILGGLEKPTMGQVTFLQQNLRGLTEDERALLRREAVGIVFQFFNLIPFLTAYENVALPLRLVGWEETKLESRVNELLDLVGLTERSEHRPAHLSGGEQQRVAIARALAANPSVLLADEPTGNLDSVTRQEITALLCRLNKEQGLTIVVATHDYGLTEVASSVYYLQDGLLEGSE